jgi:hypothetical protein
MKSLSHSLLAATFALLSACGGSESADDPVDGAVNLPDGRIPTILDAAPDADLRDATPPPVDDAGVLSFGPGVVLDDVRFAESGHSWAGWAPLVNPNFMTAINDGTMILLVEFRNLDDPTGQNDSDVSVAIYVATDTDGNASNNHSGNAMLRVSQESLDGVGNPRALLPNASITNGHLTGSVNGEILLFLPGIGGVKIQDPTFSADLIADTGNTYVAEMRNAELNGVILARHLEEVPNPVTSTCLANSMLDLVALPCLSFDGVQPDVDRDGDGLETFDEIAALLDGKIDTCSDGDGTTYVSTPGAQCVLDPAFQDAYTAKIEVGGVRAFLLPPL